MAIFSAPKPCSWLRHLPIAVKQNKDRRARPHDSNGSPVHEHAIDGTQDHWDGLFGQPVTYACSSLKAAAYLVHNMCISVCAHLLVRFFFYTPKRPCRAILAIGNGRDWSCLRRVVSSVCGAHHPISPNHRVLLIRLWIVYLYMYIFKSSRCLGWLS